MNNNKTCKPNRSRFSRSIWGFKKPIIKRFRRDKKGVTAVEFALVALPFFAILFAILETSLLFFAEQTLETGVFQAARMIRTGEVKQQGMNAAQFKTLVCSNIPALLTCASISVDVRSFPDFGSISLPPARDKNGDLVNNFVFSPGEASEIVVVRVYYPWKLFTPFSTLSLANASANTRILASSAAFRNEPFPF